LAVCLLMPWHRTRHRQIVRLYAAGVAGFFVPWSASVRSGC
jgi:hypothetical protein